MIKVGIAVTAVSIAMLGGSAALAQGDPQRHLSRACAAYDLHAINLIEEDGPKVSGSAVASAFEALVKARTACTTGRYVEGVAIYETIALVPVPVTATNVSAASR